MVDHAPGPYVESQIIPLLVASAVLLAGCLEGPGTDPARQDVTPTASEDVASSRASGLSPVESDLNDETPSESVEHVISMTWASQLSSGVWVCEQEIVQNCTGHELSEGQEMLHREFSGSPRGAKLRLSWSATSPFTSNLTFGLMGMCLENCTGGGYTRMVEGASPLTIDAKDIQVRDNEVFCLFVSMPQIEAGTVFVYASFRQEFRVDGTVTVISST